MGSETAQQTKTAAAQKPAKHDELDGTFTGLIGRYGKLTDQKPTTQGQGRFLDGKSDKAGFFVFDFGKNVSDLAPNQMRALAAGLHDTKKKSTFVVIGHASSDEDPLVAGLRASAVAAYIQDKAVGVKEGQILDSYGSDTPVVEEKAGSAEAKAQNRSVEVKITTVDELMGGHDEQHHDTSGTGRRAPEAPEGENPLVEAGKEIAIEIVEKLVEETVLEIGMAIVKPAMLMAGYLSSYSDAIKAGVRNAYADGAWLGADVATERLHGKASRVDASIADSALARAHPTNHMPLYWPAEPSVWQPQFATAAAGVIAVFNKGMERTEELTRQRLEAKGLGGRAQATFDKVIGTVRGQVATQINMQIRHEVDVIRFETEHGEGSAKKYEQDGDDE